MAIHDKHLTQFTGTTKVITLPAISAGDSLTIYVISDISGQTITAKDGATSYSSLNNSSISGPDGQSIASFYKLVCTGSETITVTLSNGSSDTSVIVTTRSGRTAIPVLQLTTPNTSSNSSPVTVTNTGITASAGDDIEVYPAIDNVAAAVWTLTSVPAGYTPGITTSTSTWAPPAMYYQDNVSAGATGNLASVMTASGNNAGWGGYVIRWPGSSGGSDVTVAMTGQAATFTAGTLTNSTSKALTGTSATFTAGTISVNSNVTIALVGQSAAFTAGSMVPSSSIALTGQTVTATAGLLVPGISISLTGKTITTSVGSLSPAITISLHGSIIITSTGVIIPSGGTPVGGTNPYFVGFVANVGSLMGKF